jgi:hypothetical protein
MARNGLFILGLTDVIIIVSASGFWGRVSGRSEGRLMGGRNVIHLHCTALLMYTCIVHDFYCRKKLQIITYLLHETILTASL